MTPGDIPKHVLKFIEDSIDNVPELEALLLMRETEAQAWTDTEIAARIYVDPQEARRVLENLRIHELVRAAGNPTSYRFSPAKPGARELIAEVAFVYQRHLKPIAMFIHHKSSASVREFARAFDMKKDR